MSKAGKNERAWELNFCCQISFLTKYNFMKKIIFSIAGLIVLSLTTVSVRAQYVSIGPSAGVGLSWISLDESGFDQQSHVLWNAGATFVYSTESHFGFGADLKFSQEGYKISYQVSEVTYESNVNMNYLRLPLRFIYFFGDYGNAIRPKIFIGPTPGILLSAKSNTDPGASVDAKNTFNSFDLGIHAGAGINFRLAERVWLNTDVTYYHGLLDATDDDVNGDENNFNRNLGLNVGLAFGFGPSHQKEK